MKGQRIMSLIWRDKIKPPEKQLSEVKWRKATKWSGESIQKNDSEDDTASHKKNGEDARNVCQRTRRPKEQTNRDEQYIRRNQ